MKVLLLPNELKDNIYDASEKVVKKLLSLGVEVLMDERINSFKNIESVHFGKFDNMLKECDIIITIGGDGTIISASKHAIKYDKPILGINAGRLGFLAEVEMDELDDLALLAENKYVIEERMMIEIMLTNKNETKIYHAFNDFVFSKGSLSKIIDLDVYCMEKLVSSYRADGIIISTPTGSTAYSLSAGGPIVEPSMDLIILTPISPHSLFDRSIIFSPQSILNIKIQGEKDAPVYLTIDGKESVNIDDDDKVSIYAGKTYAKIINLKQKLFYEVLNKKFITRAYE